MEQRHLPTRPITGAEHLVGAIDSHVHCCPHINARTITLFDAVRAASEAGLRGLGLMDVFANTSGLAALANLELGHLGVEVFGGVILEPHVGGVSVRSVETALKMGYGPGTGARFVSLPCHTTAHVARLESRSPLYVDGCLSIPLDGALPDPLPQIVDLCVAADVVFNLGHLSGPEMVRMAEMAAARGCRRMLAPAGYLDPDQARAVAATGAVLEYSFFVMSHATDVPQTMIDAEYHQFPRANFGTCLDVIRSLDADQVLISSDSGAFVLPSPVEAFRAFLSMFLASGLCPEHVRRMTTDTPARLFRVGTAQ